MIDGSTKWAVSSFCVSQEDVSELLRSTDVLRFDHISLGDAVSASRVEGNMINWSHCACLLESTGHTTPLSNSVCCSPHLQPKEPTVSDTKQRLQLTCRIPVAEDLLRDRLKTPLHVVS
jgi:hypothetical protein